MSGRLDGAVAIVTGSTRGIGRATRAMHLTRLGVADDIANAALFLASESGISVLSGRRTRRAR